MWKKLSIAAIALLSCACSTLLTPTVNADPEALRVGQYRMDTKHATLLFKIRHFGISDYVGRFNQFDAVLDFDPENPTAARLEALIDVSSLDVNNPSFAKTLTSPKWFDASQYPQAKFVSTDIEIIDDNSGKAHGILTLRGIKKPISMDITFNGGTSNLFTGKYTIGFEARAKFKRSDFGINRHQTFVGNIVKLEFYGEFQRTSNP